MFGSQSHYWIDCMDVMTRGMSICAMLYEFIVRWVNFAFFCSLELNWSRTETKFEKFQLHKMHMIITKAFFEIFPHWKRCFVWLECFQCEKIHEELFLNVLCLLQSYLNQSTRSMCPFMALFWIPNVQWRPIQLIHLQVAISRLCQIGTSHLVTPLPIWRLTHTQW